MQINTRAEPAAAQAQAEESQAAAAQQRQILEPSADSPLKGRRGQVLQFSHFSRRYRTKLA